MLKHALGIILPADFLQLRPVSHPIPIVVAWNLKPSRVALVGAWVIDASLLCGGYNIFSVFGSPIVHDQILF